MDIEVADTMPDGWQWWLDWHRAIAPDNLAEIQALEADRGRYLGYVRVVGSQAGRRPAAGADRVGAGRIHEGAVAQERNVVDQQQSAPAAM